MNTPYIDIQLPDAAEARRRVRQFHRKRFVFAAALIVLALLSGAILYIWIKEGKSSELRAQHEEQITLATIAINRELNDIRNTLRLLSTDSDILDSLSVFNPPDKTRIGAVFSQYGRSLDHLLQLRWLDDTGQEKVRVNIEHGIAREVPESALQDKKDRYYFKSAMQVLPPELYISPFDLNSENGTIQKPFQPVVRIGVQTTRSYGMHPGLLLINYDLSHLIYELRALSTAEMDMILASSHGDWIVHPNAALEWGEVLGKSQNSVRNTDPSLFNHIDSEENRVMQPYRGQLISYRQIQLSPTASEKLYVIASTPAQVVNKIEFAALLPSILTALGILLIGGRILLRDFALQRNLHSLTETLEHEKYELKLLNTELDGSLTRQRLLQNELVESRKLSSLGMMVAGVAHELNTPIGGALISASSLRGQHGSLQHALESGLTRQALDSYMGSTAEGLELVEKNLTKAAELVKSFKRLALDRSNEEEIVEFELDQVVIDLLRSLTPKLKNSGTQIINRIDSGLAMSGYPGVVSQILQNLIINAITYGTEGMHSGEVILEATRQNGWIQLSVTDNGKGIAPELRDKLFDPFVTSGRGRGHTGLGLHLVHQWVTRLMHGRINAESPDTGGARFIIQLPEKVSKTSTDHAQGG
ncbi:HAMP domain-containing histidine kinase [Marinobacterium sp. D7]|uniref:sensor histidine kinase n=1 Tax=Marinobacterium ramblicola TaxID=2849041 RepID=UPI001C2D7FC7|nr:HAMP domain-containing sensor histidine kinase [Marinobacterium ramblicola]MBV1788185.1 HAMP domain-containing histidine kinase [Marinobacterium ramblicola]